MKIFTVSSVPIGDIRCNKSNDSFSQAEIEAMARSILQCGGVVKPLLVRNVSPLVFEVVEGELQFHAAVKANQLDYRFDHVQAIILPPDAELQAEFCRQYRQLVDKVDKTSNDDQDIREVLRSLVQNVQQINSQLAQLMQVVIKPGRGKTVANNEKLITDLNTLDRDTLALKLQKFYKKKYEEKAALVIAAREVKPFTDYHDLKTRKVNNNRQQSLFGERTLQQMIKEWE